VRNFVLPIRYVALCSMLCVGVFCQALVTANLDENITEVKVVELKPFVQDDNLTATAKQVTEDDNLTASAKQVVQDENVTVEAKIENNTTTISIANDPGRFVSIDANLTKSTDENNSLEPTPTTTATTAKNSAIEINATLKDCIKAAVKINYRVKQVKEQVLQARHQVSEARADLFPKVDITVSKTRKGTKGYNSQEYLESQGDITLTYDVFDFGMLDSTVDKQKITLKEQEMRLKGTLEEEVNKAIKAYMDVVYSKLSLAANQANFERLQKILEIVKIKRELGAATMGDESSIQASVSNAKTLLINTESSYNNAKDYYEFLVGTNAESLTPYETNFDVQLQKFDGLFSEIRTQNTDLSIIKAKIKGKQKELEIHRADNLPKVTLTISNNRKYRTDWYEPTQNGNNRESIAELALVYNLFDGGKAQAKTSRLLSEVSGLTFGLEYTALDTKWNSQKLYNSVLTNRRTLTTLNSEINASKKMVDAYWERFRLSSQDLVTLLQAQRQLNTAELEKLRSEKTMYVDYFDLLTKRGRLLEYFGM
jgi:outer membrane protein, adhesin transport system